MPPRAPEGFRWCKTCNEYRPIEEFGNYLNAYCHPHWLVWNRAKAARRRQTHPGEDARRRREWAKKNPEEVKARNKAWAADQKAKGYPHLKKWIREKPEKARKMWREGGKRWRENNPEKAAAARHRKRARKAKAPGHHTGEELRALFERFDGKCVYCGGDADTWDHVISLYRGGTNFVWNITPACRGCNSSKQHKLPEEFIEPQTMTREARRYIEKALKKGEALIDPGRYVRNPYEKVSEQALWDAVRGVFERDGHVTDKGLQTARFSASTIRRRLGGIKHLNERMTT